MGGTGPGTKNPEVLLVTPNLLDDADKARAQQGLVELAVGKQIAGKIQVLVLVGKNPPRTGGHNAIENPAPTQAPRVAARQRVALSLNRSIRGQLGGNPVTTIEAKLKGAGLGVIALTALVATTEQALPRAASTSSH